MARPRKTRPTLEEAFGQTLRALREQRGLSQERLGQESGSGRTYISQLERGEKSPSLKMLFKLAPKLGVSPSEIVRRVQRAIGD